MLTDDELTGLHRLAALLDTDALNAPFTIPDTLDAQARLAVPLLLSEVVFLREENTPEIARNEAPYIFRDVLRKAALGVYDAWRTSDAAVLRAAMLHLADVLTTTPAVPGPYDVLRAERDTLRGENTRLRDALAGWLGAIDARPYDWTAVKNAERVALGAVESSGTKADTK